MLTVSSLIFMHKVSALLRQKLLIYSGKLTSDNAELKNEEPHRTTVSSLDAVQFTKEKIYKVIF